MKPFIKWPGGKQEEYKIISEYFPKKINKYIEPFLGGGAVYLSIEDCSKYFINDKSEELMHLYIYIKNEEKAFFSTLNHVIKSWRNIETIVNNHNEELVSEYQKYSNDLITDDMWTKNITNFISKNKDEIENVLEQNVNIRKDKFISEFNKTYVQKTKRMKMLETKKGKLSNEDINKNIETIFKGAYYTYIRFLYNKREDYKLSNEFKTSLFYFIREYCYSSMFRYNSSGGFNVPYGGISYNRKKIETKIELMQDDELVKRLKNTDIYSLDFEDFLQQISLTEDDFVFLDPPYDSDFSTYSNNDFDLADQKRLAEYLKNIKSKFMLVIKSTEYINSLYDSDEFYIKSFDKKYLVSFKNRNDKDVEHLIITNYELD